MAIRLTQHAGERMNQRGVSRDAIDLVCLAADRTVHLKSGVRVVSLSTRRAQSLRRVFGDALVSRAERLQLVVDEFSDTILTVTKGATYRDGSQKPRRGGKRGQFSRRIHA
jgi:hypothetical protein